jgi:hypothetical protein
MSGFVKAGQTFLKTLMSGGKQKTTGTEVIKNVKIAPNIDTKRAFQDKVTKTVDKAYKDADPQGVYKHTLESKKKKSKAKIDESKKAKGGRVGLKGGGVDMGSPKNRAIYNLKEFFKNRKKSKIPKNNFNRKRSPTEVDRVISKLKSDAQAMGGDFKTASELKPLKGESKKSFESRPSTKFFNKGGRVGLKRGTGLMSKKSNVKKIKETFGPKKGLGMQSVIYGLDKNPKITKADPKAKFIAAAKKKTKKRLV